MQRAYLISTSRKCRRSIKGNHVVNALGLKRFYQYLRNESRKMTFENISKRYNENTYVLSLL